MFSRSGGASQPAASSGGASQPAEASHVELRLGTFNCGMEQAMVPHKRHTDNLKRILAKSVHEQDLHIVTFCEVGGHRRGLPTAMSAQDFVSDVLEEHYKAMNCQAYMTTWQATTAPADVSGVTLTLLAGPEVVQLSSDALDPQLVIMVFAIAATVCPDKHGLLISGNLHIRTPSGQKQPSIATKKRITTEALQALEEKASMASSGASQPTAPVLVLTGDVNLDKKASDNVVQKLVGEPSVDTQWQVLTSNAARSGDVLFFKGTIGEAFDVTVGKSYQDRGLRRDDHDFFGVALLIPMSDKNPRGQKREPALASGATQPAAKGQKQVHKEAPEDAQGKGATPESQRQVLGSWTLPGHFATAKDSGKDKPALHSPEEAPAAAADDDEAPAAAAAASSSSPARTTITMIDKEALREVILEDAKWLKDRPAALDNLARSVMEHHPEHNWVKAANRPRISRAGEAMLERSPSPPQSSSTSGASQPAALLPKNPTEKRVAKNNVAYTKAQFMAYYEKSRQHAEREWATAPPVGSGGPIMPSAEKIVQDMYDWYEARADDEDLHVVFRHLQNTLFKNVTKRLPEDVWMPPDVGGASQPAAQGEAHLVVSREYVARQVQKVITTRETWLNDNGLPLDIVLQDDLADRFLQDVKREFHSSAEQQVLQQRDADTPGKRVQTGMHSRWSRHTQKLGGTSQMWTLLSFTGFFDPAFLEASITIGAQPLRMPGERTEEQKQKVHDAQVARARVRRGKMLERLQQRLSKGEDAKGKGKRRAVLTLNAKQQRVLEDYRSGELQRQANNLTLKSGHGRLKRQDDSFVDIGGSTGGFVRTVLSDWEPPNLDEFAGDASYVW